MYNVEFRSFIPSDQALVKQLHSLGLEATDSEIRREILDQLDKDLNDIPHTYLRGGEFLVGFVGDALVAMGGLQPLTDRRAEIKRVRVHPSVQGQGVEANLFGLLENKAMILGYGEVMINTSSSNTGLQQHLLAHGYAVEETEHNKTSPLTMVKLVKQI